MTTNVPLQQCACTMQIQTWDLLQDRAVKSLAALLKPPDRDIPKRAEVQSADPRVTKLHRVCQATGRDITFESRVFIIHSYMARVNPCPCADPDFAVKSTVFGVLFKWAMLVQARADSLTAEEKAQLETDREGSVETITTTRRGGGASL